MESDLFCSIPLHDDEIEKLSRFVFDNFGINLTEAKRGLVSGRLHSVLKKHGFTSFLEYYEAMKEDRNGLLLSEFINKISTNFTYFYRESDHFDLLRTTILPSYEHELKNKDLRIWCAGCSSGEEPYTVTMALLEYFREKYAQWKAGVLATDISEDVLKFAKAAVYPEDRLKMLPKEWVKRYFKSLPNDQFQVKEKVLSEVHFGRLNLMNGKYPFRSRFHIVFCRNVMIYFDQPTKNDLIDRFVDILHPGGYLFIGHSETISRSHPKLSFVRPSVYRKLQ